MFRKLARVPKHKKFEYQPRFYDPDKEDLEKRKRWAEAEKQRKLNDKKEESNNSPYEESVIRGSFGRAKEKRKTLFGGVSIALLAVMVVGAVFVFKNLGSNGLDLSWGAYLILLILPIYILIRIRANSKS